MLPEARPSSTESEMTRVFEVPCATNVLNDALTDESSGASVSHYMRHYLIVAEGPVAALEILRSDVEAEGASLLSADPPREVSAAELPKELQARRRGSSKQVVLWRSGRVFFPSA